MNRLALATVLAATTLAMAAPASATETTTREWFLPAGVTPSDPFATWWPQTVTDPGCSWKQLDRYRYDTADEKRIVEALDDDRLLTLINGQPEDSAVYLSHVMVPPADGCNTPTSTTTTTGSTPSPTTTSVPVTATSTTSRPTKSAPSTTVPATSSTTTPTSPPSTRPSTPPRQFSKPPKPASTAPSRTAPPELALTGGDLSDGAYVALFCIFVGGILGAFGWLLSRKPRDPR